MGDAFSFWFKSNTRNHQLIKEYVGGRRTARPSDWIFVFGILGLLAVIVGAGLLVSLFVIQQLLKLITGH